ncbi:MAG: DUF177 domain-containing protein [Acidobacteriota bacterium]|nr:MAG: DUF177 domain-containing protein [Acidobacteriota bacterium]
MKIILDQVSVQPRQIDESFGQDEVELDDEAKLVGDAAFSGTVRKEGVRVLVEGTVTADVEMPCSRCLEKTTFTTNAHFVDVLVDSEYEPTDAELQVSDDGLDESLVIGGEVELAELVRERILLELPEICLCSDDCKGLCPKCGVNWNTGSCDCSDQEIDPRWAALQNLN